MCQEQLAPLPGPAAIWGSSAVGWATALAAVFLVLGMLQCKTKANWNLRCHGKAPRHLEVDQRCHLSRLLQIGPDSHSPRAPWMLCSTFGCMWPGEAAACVRPPLALQLQPSRAFQGDWGAPLPAWHPPLWPEGALQLFCCARSTSTASGALRPTQLANAPLSPSPLSGCLWEPPNV